jgi:hypothetical protein
MAVLKTSDGERAYPLDAPRVILGREDCAITVMDRKASRRHAQITHQGARFVITDIGSTNGTFVNGHRLQGARPLQTGDRVRIGDSELIFEGDEDIAHAPTQAIDEAMIEDRWPSPPQEPARSGWVVPGEDAQSSPPPSPGWDNQAGAARPPFPQGASAYPMLPSKKRSTALILEILPGLFGLLGFGWIYAGKTGTGIMILIGDILANLFFALLAALTLGISLIITVPVQLIVLGISAALLHSYTKDHPETFGD